MISSELRDTIARPAPALTAQRTRMLNVLLAVAAAGSGVMVVIDVREAISIPAKRPYAAVYLVVVMALAAMAALRRLSFRVRARSLLLIGFAGSTLLLYERGLAGVGRLYLLALAAMSTILLGEGAGQIAGMLSVAVFIVFGVSVHAGLVPANGILQPAASLLQTWVGGGLGFALAIAALVAPQWVAGALDARACLAQRSTSRRERATARVPSDHCREREGGYPASGRSRHHHLHQPCRSGDPGLCSARPGWAPVVGPCSAGSHRLAAQGG